MSLVRVLERAVPLRRRSEALPLDERNICGSAGTHFRPSTQGRLSVFVAGNAEFERRIALAMALSRKEVDDVQYCRFRDDVADELACQIEENEGRLALEDVNEAHRDLVDVSLFSVSRMAVLGVDSGVVSIPGSELVLEIIERMDRGEIQRDMLKDELWDRIVQTRAYKRYQRKQATGAK